MTAEEKQILSKLIDQSANLVYDTPNADEVDDRTVATEMKQASELLSYAADMVMSQKSPGLLRKWGKRLWYHVKKAIANFLREIACASDPDCKN